MKKLYTIAFTVLFSGNLLLGMEQSGLSLVHNFANRTTTIIAIEVAANGIIQGVTAMTGTGTATATPIATVAIKTGVIAATAKTGAVGTAAILAHGSTAAILSGCTIS